MRIVHVSPYYAPHIGGVEAVAQRLSEALAKKGHKVHVITSSVSQSFAKATEKKVFIEALPAFEFAHIPFAPSLFPRVHAALKEADLLHVHAGIAYYPEVCIAVAKLLRKPVVVTFHCDTEPSGTFGFILPLYNNTLLGASLRAADAVVCLTRDHAEIARTKYGVNREKLKIIPNGIDDFFFSFRRPAPGRKNGVLDLLFVGRIVKQKNLPRLLEAVRILKKKQEVILRIAGSGEEERKIRAVVKENGLEENVIFLGGVSKKEMPKWRKLFSESDIFVVSSDYEGVPVALMEAMAGAIPAVATDVRGVREVAKGLAVLAQPTPQGVSSAVEKLFHNQYLMKTLSAKARAFVQKFRWDKIASEYEKVYFEVVK